MIKNARRFLLISFSALAVVCVIMFELASSSIEEDSKSAISEVGEIYMTAMAKQTLQKFDAVIDLQIMEMKGILERHPPESEVYGEEMLEQLALSAQVRSFSYLGLYTEDGECQVIYGDAVEYQDEKTFLAVLNDSSLRVFSGINTKGERQLCMLTEVEYPMQGGKKSTAMVAALPMDYLERILALDEEDSLMYSFIIRKDGTYVVRTREDNYFEHISEMFAGEEDKTAQEYALELQRAINANEDYSTVLRVANGEYQSLLCTHLPDSEWYLISVMPFGVLDNILQNMDNSRQNTIMIAGVIVLAGLLLIFILYYRISQQQMKELDQARREATKANKAKSEFLSSMSHDIRTPMNGIVGMTAIAMANINDMARVKDCLGKITLSSKHLLGLINDVLDMSKIESGKLSLNMNQVSLREAMENIVNIVQPQVKARKQHFDIFIQNICAEEVHCDSIRLNQVLINLLSNAIKFTPEGGRVNIYLEQEASPLGDNYVRCHFRVKDNGIGMTKEFQEKIFETFTREEKAQVDKTEGTGLGMAITKAIVDVMNGTIELNSEPGRGTEFHVILDFEKAEVKEEDMVLPPWKMLVVDNNEDLCLSAVSSLKEIGITAEWATDGKTAVEMVKKRHGEQDDYEVVLLDWKMPDMDGLHTAREIRKHLGDNVPILIISAYDWSDIEEEAREVGIYGFISKPLFKSNLFLGLSKYLLNTSKVEAEKLVEGRDFEGKHILLAEDNDLNWEIAQEILSEAGFTLERAENGQICVDKFAASKPGAYDLILMDIRMPVMNGYEAAKAIRALSREDKDLPILAMTADAFSDDIQRCLACGMNEHIAKPIDVGRLTQILKKYIK
jgi:signal transduction histidine kinase/CheY-like chemotaxis protein/chemotaxis protein CheY-P-specific phosphatase CheC